MNTFKEEEKVMKDHDELIFSTAEAKNNVEAYIYDMQQKLGGDFALFISKEDKERFLQKLSEKEEWLQLDGEKETRDVYRKTLEELHSHGTPIAKRKDEDSRRPMVIKVLDGLIDEFRAFAASTDENYSHITQEERQKVLDKCNEIEGWEKSKLEEQSRVPLFADPVFTCEEIKDKTHSLSNVCNPIMKKLKPKVEEKKEEKKEEEKKEEEKKEEKKEEEEEDADIGGLFGGEDEDEDY